MSDYTLEPFEWVEIDQDFCSRTHSTAPCTATLEAGGSECFNTRFTCQDPANYDRGAPLVLRFCVNQAFLPDDGYYMPTLISARTSAGSINPVGAGQNSSALGTRGGLAVEFQDGPHTDKWVDPYVANRHGRDLTYIPVNRGTFWTKWRARNPYYVGRQIRHKTGFINTATHAVESVVTRTYFITGFEGPGADGRVTIQARDLLSLVSNDKATAPFASKGKLLNDITDSQTTLQLDPIGIGDEEYALAGIVRLGSELCDYTRLAGSDTLTVVRGRYNTDPKSAKAGDVVQKCLVYSAQRPAAILEDLLTNYAGIAPGYLDLAQWAQEQTDYLPRLYGAIIATPTGVLDLINEMCQQMYFYPVWDERQAKLKIRAIRPSDGEEVKALDDFSNLIEGSVQLRDLPDQLVTQVWVFYGIINPTASATDDNNFAVREIVATSEGAPEKQGIEKIKKIYCRWISEGGAAVELGEKFIARYGAAPRQASFALAEKDASLWLGDFVSLNHRLSVDTFGSSRALNMQVMSAQQARAGVLFQYVCQEFVFEKPVDITQKLLVVSYDHNNFNLRDYYDANIGIPPVAGDTINVVIRSGVVIGARSVEDIQSYTGSVRYEHGTTTYAARTLHPIMRKGLVSRSFLPHGTQLSVNAAGERVPLYTPGSFMYSLQSDLREVPCSVAFDTGLWPPGVTINVLQESGAYVEGEAGLSSSHFGMGGEAAVYLGGRGGLLFASDGGAALRIRHPVNWNNQGTISGGGAGGWPGVINGIFRYGIGEGFWVMAAPSGGGAGRFSAPVVTPDAGNVGPLVTINRTASAGSSTAGGYGAKMTDRIGSAFIQVTGGDGGNLGAVGTSGAYANLTPYGYFTVKYPETKTGGRVGDAIVEGASLITWINKGDVRGAEIA